MPLNAKVGCFRADLSCERSGVVVDIDAPNRPVGRFLIFLRRFCLALGYFGKMAKNVWKIRKNVSKYVENPRKLDENEIMVEIWIKCREICGDPTG